EQAKGPLADFEQDAALVLEVHVERGGRDPDLVGDLADRGALIALGDENALGRLQDFGAPEMAVALGLAGGTVWRGGSDRQGAFSLLLLSATGPQIGRCDKPALQLRNAIRALRPEIGSGREWRWAVSAGHEFERPRRRRPAQCDAHGRLERLRPAGLRERPQAGALWAIHGGAARAAVPVDTDPARLSLGRGGRRLRSHRRGRS